MPCNKNINTVQDLNFSLVNDEFNWTNSNTNAQIETVDGQLQLKPVAINGTFSRVLGNVDANNNRVRLVMNFDVFKPQGSANNTLCASVKLMVGSVTLDEFTIYEDGLVGGDQVEHNFEREYNYESLTGPVTLVIEFLEGAENELHLDYLLAEDYFFCEDDVRTYFGVGNLLKESFDSTSSAIQLLEWQVDGVETLTPTFFSENNTPGGNPVADWFFAKANIDGSNRVSELSNFNTFNPFESEWGLDFDTIDSFHGGKPTGVTSGSDYGAGLLQIGLGKPVVLNDDLEELFGAFFIDIDYSKDLQVSFNVVVNKLNADVFNSPEIFRRYTILWSAQNCKREFFYRDELSEINEITDVIRDGFLYGITGSEKTNVFLDCTDTISRTKGETGVFEFTMDFGSDTGQSGISFVSGEVPVKFDIEWDGNTVTSRYVGSDIYDQALQNEGISPLLINTAPAPGNGTGTLLFDKTTASPETAIVRVTAPLEGSEWTISGVCPSGTSGKAFEVGEADCGNLPVNWENVFIDTPNASTYTPSNGDVLYADLLLTTPYDGGDQTHRLRRTGFLYDLSFDVSSAGVISNVTSCQEPDPTVIDQNNIDTCYTEWFITVNVPSGETREVQFISNFAPSGDYEVFNPPTNADVNVLNDQTYNINADTQFYVAIDGIEIAGGQQATSLITMLVRKNGSVIDQINLTRLHADANC